MQFKQLLKGRYFLYKNKLHQKASNPRHTNAYDNEDLWVRLDEHEEVEEFNTESLNLFDLMVRYEIKGKCNVIYDLTNGFTVGSEDPMIRRRLVVISRPFAAAILFLFSISDPRSHLVWENGNGMKLTRSVK